MTNAYAPWTLIRGLSRSRSSLELGTDAYPPRTRRTHLDTDRMGAVTFQEVER
jgi:hypothetical protein